MGGEPRAALGSLSLLFPAARKLKLAVHIACVRRSGPFVREIRALARELRFVDLTIRTVGETSFLEAHNVLFRKAVCPIYLCLHWDVIIEEAPLRLLLAESADETVWCVAAATGACERVEDKRSVEFQSGMGPLASYCLVVRREPLLGHFGSLFDSSRRTPEEGVCDLASRIIATGGRVFVKHVGLVHWHRCETYSDSEQRNALTRTAGEEMAGNSRGAAPKEDTGRHGHSTESGEQNYLLCTSPSSRSQPLAEMEDALTLTRLPRELKRAFPECRVLVSGKYLHAFFHNNPFVDERTSTRAVQEPPEKPWFGVSGPLGVLRAGNKVLQRCYAYGIIPSEDVPDILVSKDEYDAAERWLCNRQISGSFCAFGFSPEWQPTHAVVSAVHTLARQYPVILVRFRIGSSPTSVRVPPADEALAKAVRSLVRLRTFWVSGSTASLRSLSALMAKASGFIGPPGVPMHLAAAFGKPSVVLLDDLRSIGDPYLYARNLHLRLPKSSAEIVAAFRRRMAGEGQFELM